MTSAQPIPETRPISDIRTHLAEIEALAKESAAPIVLTRNGAPSLVVFDAQVYNAQIESERHLRMLREAEIESKYHSETLSLKESKSRMAKIREVLESTYA